MHGTYKAFLNFNTSMTTLFYLKFYFLAWNQVTFCDLYYTVLQQDVNSLSGIFINIWLHNKWGVKVSYHCTNKSAWSATHARLAGIGLSNKWKFLVCSIALSTWILRDAILLVSTSSCPSNWGSPQKKGGMFNDTSSGRSKSLTSNPLSYHPSLAKAGDLIVWSVPYQKYFQSRGKRQKQIAPEGVIPINDLKVLVFL